MRPERVAGLVLAGGQGRRLGGGKALRLLAGRSLLAHAIGRLAPQVAVLAVNTADPAIAAAAAPLPVIPDGVPGFAGPLAGLLAGLDWAAGLTPPASHLGTAPCDAPFLPPDLIARLAEALASEPGAAIACAASAGRTHPVVALWPVGQRAALARAVLDEGLTRVAGWVERWPVVRVDFPPGPPDPFFNINTPAELAEAERLAGRHP